MRRHPLFLLLFFPLLAFGQMQTITYPQGNTEFLSPERGFYRYTATRASAPEPLTVDALEAIRAEGRTLIFRYIYLDSFLDSPISEDFLQQIEADFAAIRAAGFKVILRFAYTSELPASPPYNDSPPKPLLLEHIAQLKPILQANSDLLLTLQNGFWGVWGENYYSDEFGSVADAPLTPQNWADRREVTDSLLAVLPAGRLLSVRYPLLKSNFYDFNIPEDSLTAAEAYSGSIKSRIGYHNDCFLVAANDYTFGNTNTEKPYWEAESRYTIMGGESCGDTPEYTNCNNALTDLENAHWTYLNDYYHPDVLDRWEQEGCLEEIRRRLGYRLSLLSGTYEETTNPGDAFAFSLSLKNEGFAAPVNPRLVALIFHKPGVEYRISLPLELRRWYGGGTYTHDFNISLPEDMLTGNYQLYLHLPDTAPALADNPHYAIRFANPDLWEESTGYHDLQMEVEVMPVVSTLKNARPNPCFSLIASSEGVYYIQSTSSNYQLQVMDMMGRQLQSHAKLSRDYELSLSGQPAGVYLLKLRCKKHGLEVVRKVVR